MDLNLGYTQTLIKRAKNVGMLRNQLAYVLATAYWETARTMKPVSEAYWIKNAEAWRKKNLRYYPWYGRGFVQLTWKANYEKAGKELGIDLTTDPNDALNPEIAADICIAGMLEGWFTGKKLSDYITLQHSDFVHARKIINGTDKAQEIAKIAEQYDDLLKEIGYGSESFVKEPIKVVQPNPDDPGVLHPKGAETSVKPPVARSEPSLLSTIIALLISILGGKPK